MKSNLQIQKYSSHYIIDSNASVLPHIYNSETSLVCYCQPASWALSRAAQSFVTRHPDDRFTYQGEISPKLIQQLSSKFTPSPHGNLILGHIELMLEMFNTLLQPEEIGLRVIACQHAHSPAFHENRMIARMTSSLGGSGEQWIERQDAQYFPLQKNQTTAQIKPPQAHTINSLCDGDIAIYKGTSWLEHEHNALISASPTFNDKDAKLCVYIDFIS
ncbi:DUF1826 domain-containing protein [Pseudoalteromonas sp. MMG005]|uniref:DUF1826 domain-containing protein n=1 Tax=Pseudoalteromonas sp. MMG005 TaxID=2822682 RepID=UPI001B39FFFD|nr:DUF1826 domain-containing protein [Pseudoalteromonas sp. MMG005]MBQ4845939.1 DUF1826 domain-containing protein [Pseudoalteromonas sp. MMG005]